jgi:hypothetical protein
VRRTTDPARRQGEDRAGRARRPDRRAEKDSSMPHFSAAFSGALKKAARGQKTPAASFAPLSSLVNYRQIFMEPLGAFRQFKNGGDIYRVDEVS